MFQLTFGSRGPPACGGWSIDSLSIDSYPRELNSTRFPSTRLSLLARGQFSDEAEPHAQCQVMSSKICIFGQEKIRFWKRWQRTRCPSDMSVFNRTDGKLSREMALRRRCWELTVTGMTDVEPGDPLLYRVLTGKRSCPRIKGIAGPFE